MQPLRILDTPVTMRYIKYIVDKSRVCMLRMYVSLRLFKLYMYGVYVCVCVRATRGACLYLLSCVCSHTYIVYIYPLRRLSFVYYAWLSTRPRISLVRVRYLTALSL